MTENSRQFQQHLLMFFVVIIAGNVDVLFLILTGIPVQTMVLYYILLLILTGIPVQTILYYMLSDII